MDIELPKCDLFILSAVTDNSFIQHTLPHQIKQNNVTGSKFLRIDTSPITGYYKDNRKLSKLENLEYMGKDFLKEGLIDEILKIRYDSKLIKKTYAKHFNQYFKETHCFRGYPFYGSVLPFEISDSEYLAHLDSDILIYQKPGFSWIKEAIQLMENNPDIVCCLPLSGPPSDDGKLNQGLTEYTYDPRRQIYLFKNFTSRIFVVNKARFLSLLPMKALWLSWREPLKSKYFGKGKLLCWEASVSHALEKSELFRADLASKSSWSLHPVERSDRFYQNIDKLINLVESGFFPDQQAGQYELDLDWWF